METINASKLQNINITYTYSHQQIKNYRLEMEEALKGISSSLHKIAVEYSQLYESIAPQLLAIKDSAIEMAVALQASLLNTQDPQAALVNQLKQVFNTIGKINPDDYSIAEIANISIENKQEAASIVSEAFAESDNLEQAIMHALKTAEKKHPLIYKVILFLLNTIIPIIISQSCSLMRETARDAKLRDNPSSNSPIIITISSGTPVKVIGEAPYYFEIEYNNPKTGEVQIGWLSKRTVQELPVFEETTIDNL